jgi:hypothetical protein
MGRKGVRTGVCPGIAGPWGAILALAERDPTEDPAGLPAVPARVRLERGRLAPLA